MLPFIKKLGSIANNVLNEKGLWKTYLSNGF